MAYLESEARELVAAAGRRLKREGLIARTWGNLSARISDTQFVITPSGMDYDMIGPDDLVPVRISDCSYEGERKPSSEKGIHADAYRLRPEVNFVIHTHQDQASVFGILGKPLETEDNDSVLGRLIPCAEYGLPSTKKLRQAVAKQLRKEPEALAVLLRNHGALCMGKDYAEAFLVARELEKACESRKKELFDGCGQERFGELGKSQRKGNRFCLLLNGERRIYDLSTRPEELPLEAAIHGEIYRNSDVCYAAGETAPAVTAFCSLGEPLLPYLDDLAQIAGISVRFSGASPEGVRKALRGRNAVLVRGRGALCTGKTADDVTAVRMILRKGCEAGLLARAWNGRNEAGGLEKCLPLGEADARLQRLIYRKKYSKKKDKE
ncbi:MAG: class II aldolase/adducin family protein [Lachnospiraceae bacterium]|nr:class II aldolase/adducin family protein [Lachnospiraceae bacterium]